MTSIGSKKSAKRADSRMEVSYYYDAEIGNYFYGPGHPMKPNRVCMTDSLISSYGLNRKMKVIRSPRATYEEMTGFHSCKYIEFLATIASQRLSDNTNKLTRYNVGDDCPVFDGLYDFSQLSVGGSLAAALKLNNKECDIAINWAGGLHHAKMSEASGFCYANDIVIAIIELLKHHERVLYIDIDVHHGDGVEEAFFATNRVMTLSFHKYGYYFPGTGRIDDIGMEKGEHYAINFPLESGIRDKSYKRIFKPLVTEINELFRPSVIVMQCGADSLADDRLGCFNLTIEGHADCVDHVKKLNIPLLLLGGGGYTIRNVARCWTLETARVLDVELSDDLPYNDYYEYYSPDFKLHVPKSSMPNDNKKEDLQAKLQTIREYLKNITHAPSVGMSEQQDAAFDINEADKVEADSADPDERVPQGMRDKMIEKDGDLLDRAESGETSELRNRYRSKNYRKITAGAAGGRSFGKKSGKRIKSEDF